MAWYDGLTPQQIMALGAQSSGDQGGDAGGASSGPWSYTDPNDPTNPWGMMNDPNGGPNSMFYQSAGTPGYINALTSNGAGGWTPQQMQAPNHDNWFDNHFSTGVKAFVAAMAGGAAMGPAAGAEGATAGAGDAYLANGMGSALATDAPAYAAGVGGTGAAVGASGTLGTTAAGTGLTGAAASGGGAAATGGTAASGGGLSSLFGGTGAAGSLPSWYGPAASALGGVLNYAGSRQAASAMTDAAGQSNATQLAMYNQTRADNAPFLANGVAASNTLAQRLGIAGDPNSAGYGSLGKQFSSADLNADPVYNSGLQFGLSEGEKGINNQAAASGSLLSGATLKALTKYGNDYASTKANDSYTRFNNDQTNQYNRLAGVAGSGQQANNLVGQIGSNTANQIGNTQTSLGSSLGASAIAGTNALAGGLTGGYNAYNNSQLTNALMGRMGRGSSAILS